MLNNRFLNFFILLKVSNRFNLFGQLFLAKLVKSEELSGQGDVLQESTTGQLDTNDDLTIGNHHGHVPELNLFKEKVIPVQQFLVFKTTAY